MSRVLSLWLFFVLGLAPQVLAQKQLLYALDFTSHAVGQPPLVGSTPEPCRIVSDVLFGDPTVVAQHGPLFDQPLQFGNGTLGYDQILLNVDDYIYAARPPYLSYERFSCAFDLVISDLTSQFSMHFSGSTIYSIYWRPDGTVSAWTSQGQVPLGNFVFGAKQQVRVEMDLWPSVRTMTFSLDGVAAPGVPVYGVNGQVPRLRRIRWNLEGSTAGESLALDNVKVFGAGGASSTDLGYASAGGADLSIHSGVTNSLDVHCATPGWPIALLLADASMPVPLFGGVLVPDLASGFVVSATADADGSFWLTVPYTAQPMLRYLQAATLSLPSLEIVFSNAIEAWL